MPRKKSKVITAQTVKTQKLEVHPFFAALALGNDEMVLKAIASGEDVNMHFTGGNRTPLHVAVHKGFQSIVEILLKHKADPNAVSDDNQTPLHVAAQNNHFKLISVLKKGGAVIDARAGGGYTPLQVAAQEGHLAAVEELHRCGANINAITDLGLTALHEAAARGFKAITLKLLDLKADPEIRDKQDLTAANMAHENQFFEVRDIICAKMTFQQQFIQNIVFVLHSAIYDHDSKQGQFIQMLLKEIIPLNEADKIFSVLHKQLNSDHYTRELKGTMKPTVPLLVANMKQYNEAKTRAIEEVRRTREKERLKGVEELKESDTKSPLNPVPPLLLSAASGTIPGPGPIPGQNPNANSDTNPDAIVKKSSAKLEI